MPKAANKWQVGDATITSIEEIAMHGADPDGFMHGTSREHVRGFDWLAPYYATPDGGLNFSIQAYVIESRGRRIIVDTCIGNDKPRNLPDFDHLSTPFLSRLSEAGFEPESFDIVLCTHMHVDHVGWNTRLVVGRWEPTFPNARYLFAQAEWDHWTAETLSVGDVGPDTSHMVLSPHDVMRDSIQPIIDAGLQQLVQADHVLTEEVRLIPTPGHTPGHVSVRIHSAGEEAVITGDMIHHPLQIADPAVGSIADFDRQWAFRTRSDFVHAHANTSTLVLGTHFPTPAGGYIVGAFPRFRFELPLEEET